LRTLIDTCVLSEVARSGGEPRVRARFNASDRILPIDVRVARVWGTITADAQGRGITVPSADGLIAATAIRHDLLVLTRNTLHFESTGARIEDPWESD